MRQTSSIHHLLKLLPYMYKCLMTFFTICQTYCCNFHVLDNIFDLGVKQGMGFSQNWNYEWYITLEAVKRYLTHYPLRDVDVTFFKSILQIYILSSLCKVGLGWVPQKRIDGKSTLVQVIAWCCQAPSHHLSQCKGRSMMSPGLNELTHWNKTFNFDKCQILHTRIV